VKPPAMPKKVKVVSRDARHAEKHVLVRAPTPAMTLLLLRPLPLTALDQQLMLSL
jgi:hypothetical protein